MINSRGFKIGAAKIGEMFEVYGFKVRGFLSPATYVRMLIELELHRLEEASSGGLERPVI
jgi:hypothetical protein